MPKKKSKKKSRRSSSTEKNLSSEKEKDLDFVGKTLTSTESSAKEWIEQDRKQLLAWVNTITNSLLTKVEDFDSVLCVKLISTLYARVFPAHNQKPQTRIHHLDNYSLCFDALSEVGVNLTGIDMAGLIDGNPRKTCAFLGAILRHAALLNINELFVLDEDTSDVSDASGLSPRALDLLTWVQSMFLCKASLTSPVVVGKVDPSLNVTDLCDSFAEGRIFGIIVAYFAKKLELKYENRLESLAAENVVSNFDYVFDTAAELFNVSSGVAAHAHPDTFLSKVFVQNYLSIIISSCNLLLSEKKSMEEEAKLQFSRGILEDELEDEVGDEETVEEETVEEDFFLNTEDGGEFSQDDQVVLGAEVGIVPEETDSPLKTWERERKKVLKRRQKKAAADKKEIEELAVREIAEFYSKRQLRMEKRAKQMKEAEIEAKKQVTSDNFWAEVAKLVDLNASAQNKDRDRMRKLILKLKNENGPK